MGKVASKVAVRRGKKLCGGKWASKVWRGLAVAGMKVAKLLRRRVRARNTLDGAGRLL